MKRLSIILILTGAITLVTCKSAEKTLRLSTQEETISPSIVYPPYDWEFRTPIGWVPMSERKQNALINRGKKLVKENSNGKGNAIKEKFILALEHKKETALFINSTTPASSDSTTSPYHRSRIQRFNYYKQTYSRWDLDTFVERKGVYLGEMYFEALFLKAVSKFGDKNVVSQQAVFETQRDNLSLTLSMVSNNESVYDDMLKSIMNSTFSASENLDTRKWQKIELPDLEFHLPKNLKKAPAKSKKNLLFTNKKSKSSLSINQIPKASSATMGEVMANDLPSFNAKLSFGVDKLSSQIEGISDIKETFISGKRCFIGSYLYRDSKTSFSKHFVYVVGRKSDFEFSFDLPQDRERGRKIIRQIVSSLKEN